MGCSALTNRILSLCDRQSQWFSGPSLACTGKLTAFFTAIGVAREAVRRVLNVRGWTFPDVNWRRVERRTAREKLPVFMMEISEWLFVAFNVWPICGDLIMLKKCDCWNAKTGIGAKPSNPPRPPFDQRRRRRRQQ